MVRSRGGQRDPLESRPWVRHALQRELATGNQTQSALARKYGVSPSSITEFKQRHAEKIEAIRADAENEFAGLLIAEKANRLAVYERLLEHAMGATDSDQGDDEGEAPPVDGKLAARVLRQIAEEMGHLPTRMQVSGELGTTTRYVISDADGNPIDIDKLK